MLAIVLTAVSVCMSSYTHAQSNAGFYYNRGKSRPLGAFNAYAIADFTKAIELKPDYSEAYAARGGMKILPSRRPRPWLWIFDVDGAIADYSKAIELKPDDGGYYGARAYAKRLRGDVVGAFADYARAASIKSNDGENYKEQLAQLALVKQHFVSQGQEIPNTRRPAVSTQPYRAYIGSGLPGNQVGVLSLPKSLQLLTIDGYILNFNWDGSARKDLEKYGNSDPIRRTELLPGHHTIRFSPNSWSPR
jgi:tetratricopeptide (TPR) repeat protein